MIPLRDNIPSRTTPVVNFSIIGICAVVFLMQLATPRDQPTMVEEYGMIPARVKNPAAEVEIVVDVKQVMTERGPDYQLIKRPAVPAVIPPIFTLLTCIFLHGGWMHFLGNTWVLYIFGDNVEDRLGHVGYLLFYLFCGVAASAAHYLSGPNSTVPTIGASGAIAGVMGAYFIWYPKAQVQALVPLFFIIQIMVLPAPLFLGLWFLLQFMQGAAIAYAIGGTPLVKSRNDYEVYESRFRRVRRGR